MALAVAAGLAGVGFLLNQDQPLAGLDCFDADLELALARVRDGRVEAELRGGTFVADDSLLMLGPETAGERGLRLTCRPVDGREAPPGPSVGAPGGISSIRAPGGNASGPNS